MKTSTNTTYTVSGSIRGTLATGKTLEQATRIMDADKRDCRSLGGRAYSDAKIIRDDGTALTDAEGEQVARYLYEA